MLPDGCAVQEAAAALGLSPDPSCFLGAATLLLAQVPVIGKLGVCAVIGSVCARLKLASPCVPESC